MNKFLDTAQKEISSFQFRLFLLKLLTFFIPKYIGCRWRTIVFRLVGFQFGRGTLIGGMPTITGEKDFYKRLIIGEEVWVNYGCIFDPGAPITIGDRVDIGHEVLILTSSHEIGSPRRRAAKRTTGPVNIENGVWLGARSVILPGVTVGEGAIVAAGSVVTKNVEPNTIVAGVPAKVIRDLAYEYA